MRWLVFIAVLLFSFQLVLAENPVLTVSETSAPSGTEIFISASWSGGDLLEILANSESINETSCSGGCGLTASFPLSQDVIVKASGRSFGADPVFSESVTVSVVDNVGPEVGLSIPDSGSISEELKFDIQVSDGDVSLVEIAFADGASDEQDDVGSCSSSPCEVTFYHTYQETGDYTVSVNATDAEDAVTTKTHTINIDSSLDEDADGVLDDEEDVCLGTRDSLADSVATLGDFKGCSCAEVEENNLGDDGDACTRTECSLTSGELIIDYPLIPDGGQPEGYSDSGTVDYSCVDGEVVEEYLASCEPQASTAC